MAHTDKSINMATVEDYYRKSSRFAAKFLQVLMNHSILQRKKMDFEQRNQQHFQGEDSTRNFQKMMVGFYLAAGLVQGIFLKNMVDAAFFKGMKDGQFWYVLLSILAAVAPLGFSLCAGYCFHNINMQSDLVIKNKLRFQRNWLFAFLFISLGYLGFVVVLTLYSNGFALGEMILVPVLAVMELVLGIPAALGINLFNMEYTQKQLSEQLKRNVGSIFNHSEQCAIHYRNYTLHLRHYNQAHPEMPMELQSSPQIERAIQYYEGRWNQDNWPQLE